MVEGSHHDLVARFQFAPDGPGQGESERGHVLAEVHLVALAAQEIRHSLVSFEKHCVRAPAGGKRTCCVGVVVQQIVAYRVRYLLRHLRARRRV